MTQFAHHAARMENQRWFDRLAKIAADAGHRVEFVPTIYRGAWPNASARPYHLFHGYKRSTFGSLDRLEAKLRGMGA